MAERKPWLRQKGETDKAFAAFTAYLELGPDRSITTAAGNPEGAPKPTQWKKWSSANDWVARASAYDDHLWNLKLARRERTIERARQHIVDNSAAIVERLTLVALGMTDAQSHEVTAARALLARVGLVEGSTTEHRGEVTTSVVVLPAKE